MRNRLREDPSIAAKHVARKLQQMPLGRSKPLLARYMLTSRVITRQVQYPRLMNTQ